MRQVGRDVTVGQHHFPRVQILADSRRGLHPVSRVEHGRKMRIHLFQRAEIAVQELPRQFAEESLIVGKSNGSNRQALGFQRAHQAFDLRAFSGPVNPFHHNEFSARSHEFLRVYHTLPQWLAAEGTEVSSAVNSHLTVLPKPARHSSLRLSRDPPRTFGVRRSLPPPCLPTQILPVEVWSAKKSTCACSGQLQLRHLPPAADVACTHAE